MQTKQFIQSSANVIKIVSLKKWDIIKYLEKKYSDFETHYWVVTDLNNNWIKTFIEILLYKKSYGQIETSLKTFSWDEDLEIFPATLQDIEEYFEKIEVSMNKEIQDKINEINKKQEALKRFKEFCTGEMSQQLSTPEFISISQEEYNKKIKEKKELLKQIQDENDL